MEQLHPGLLVPVQVSPHLQAVHTEHKHDTGNIHLGRVVDLPH
jgi:hypothetical protein